MALSREELEQIVKALVPLLNPQIPPFQLGTQLTFAETTTVVNATQPLQVCGPNANRVALIFSGNTTNASFVSTVQTAGASVGLALPVSAPVVLMDVNTCGTLVQLAWYGRAIGSPGNVTVFEVIYTPKPQVQ